MKNEKNRTTTNKKVVTAWIWDGVLISIILLLLTAGIVLTVLSKESLNNIAISCGTGLISSSIVSLIIEIIHMSSVVSRKKGLKKIFYNNLKKFISEFLYYSSFFLKQDNLHTIEMLNCQSKKYLKIAREYSNLSDDDKDRIKTDLDFFVTKRLNFKLILSCINNSMYESALHDIIDTNTLQCLEGIMYDYYRITDAICDTRTIGLAPYIYSCLLSSVGHLIEEDHNLDMYKYIRFYGTKEEGTPGVYTNKKKWNELSEQDKRFLTSGLIEISV